MSFISLKFRFVRATHTKKWVMVKKIILNHGRIRCKGISFKIRGNETGISQK